MPHGTPFVPPREMQSQVRSRSHLSDLDGQTGEWFGLVGCALSVLSSAAGVTQRGQQVHRVLGSGWDSESPATVHK